MCLSISSLLCEVSKPLRSYKVCLQPLQFPYICRMEDLKDSLKYQQWERELQDNGIDLRGLEELKTVRKGNGDVLFALLKIDALAPNGEPLLPIALLRGHFVGVLVCLVDDSNGDEFFLMVRQRRVATGAVMLEHPAGMVDSTKDPFDVALAEVREETGLQIDREQLVLLNDKVLHSSPGLLDEGGWFFGTEIRMSTAAIEALRGDSQGHGTEGEFIETAVLTREEAMSESTVANALLHFFLWDEWKRKNK